MPVTRAGRFIGAIIAFLGPVLTVSITAGIIGSSFNHLLERSYVEESRRLALEAGGARSRAGSSASEGGGAEMDVIRSSSAHSLGLGAMETKPVPSSAPPASESRLQRSAPGSASALAAQAAAASLGAIGLGAPAVARRHLEPDSHAHLVAAAFVLGRPPVGLATMALHSAPGAAVVAATLGDAPPAAGEPKAEAQVAADPAAACRSALASLGPEARRLVTQWLVRAATSTSVVLSPAAAVAQLQHVLAAELAVAQLAAELAAGELAACAPRGVLHVGALQCALAQ